MRQPCCNRSAPVPPEPDSWRPFCNHYSRPFCSKPFCYHCSMLFCSRQFCYHCSMPFCSRPFCSRPFCSRPFCYYCSMPFCSRPFCNRRLRQVKVTKMYVIISMNYCLLTDMMVISISTHGLGAPTRMSAPGPPTNLIWPCF